MGDGAGAVVTLELATETVPWQGGQGGWILSGDGLERVDDDDLRIETGWWTTTRRPRLDEELLVAPDREIRLHRRIARVREYAGFGASCGHEPCSLLAFSPTRQA